MNRLKKGRRLLTVIAVAAAGLAAAGVQATPSLGGAAADNTLVIDATLAIVTLDPVRSQEPGSATIQHAVYDTLLTYRNGNVKDIVPSLAQSFLVQNGGTKFVFNLRHGVKFSDGTAFTSADVVFSLTRAQNLAGTNSYMLAGVTITAPSPYQVVMTSQLPYTALPRVLTSPANSIMNSTLLKANGATNTGDAATSDHAQAFLNTSAHGAGSGPYMIDSVDPSSQVVLVANPDYWGKKPAYDRVVIRNTDPNTARLDLIAGTSQVATSLSGSAIVGLPSNLQVRASTADRVWYLSLQLDPSQSSVTSNPRFRQAVRYALDYAGIVKIAGFYAVRSAGMIPTNFPGALPAKEALQQNVDKAKAALAASGLKNPTVTMSYIGNFIFNGINFDTLAQKLQSDLGAAGITVQLNPETVANFNAELGSGKAIFMQNLGRARYADPEAFLQLFGPGTTSAAAFGYTAQVARPGVVAAAKAAEAEADPVKRLALYQTFLRKLNGDNPPWVPMFATVEEVVAAKTVTNLHPTSAGWTLDFSELGLAA